MNFSKLLFVLAITFLTLSGCSLDSKDNNTQKPENAPSHTAIPDEEMMKTFKINFPNATIVNETLIDVDDDAEDDLVFIFENHNDPFKVTKSNICVVTKERSAAIDIAGGDTNFEFAEDSDSLKVLKDPTRVSVLMKDIRENRTIDYQITITVNKEIEQINFEIAAKEQADK